MKTFLSKDTAPQFRWLMKQSFELPFWILPLESKTPASWFMGLDV